jgi:hypothetical protein
MVFVAPTPGSSASNTTALTWLNHFRAVGSTEFAAAREAALAAGIGTGNWRPVGPSEATVKSETGDIGRINAIAFQPSDPRTIHVGTPIGGLWRTQDDGESWISLTDGAPRMGQLFRL